MSEGRTDEQLEKFLLFSVMVAGKRADQTRTKLDEFLAQAAGPGTPFQCVRSMIASGLLDQVLENVRTGQYRRIAAAFRAICASRLDLRTCTVEELEAFPGVGPKTARFFLLKSRPNQSYAVLDTHLLAELRDRGVRNVPKSTPSNRREYARLERALLDICDKEGKTPADFDRSVFRKRTRSVVSGSSMVEGGNGGDVLIILAQAKALAKRYRELTGRPLGITGEIGEYEAVRLLRLKLANVREAGFDAVRTCDGREEHLQIKTRCLLAGCKPGQRIGRIELRKPWDAVLLVLLDENFEATAIYEAPRAKIEKELTAPGSKARNERGALGVNKFKAIGRKIWPTPVS